MTVPAICEALLTYFKEKADVITGTPSILKDLFVDSDQASFLNTLIRELQGKMGGDISSGDFIALQEAMAFVSAFQRADVMRKRTRMRKWQSRFQHKADQAAEGGVLKTQLYHIGSKVESEFLTQVEA